MISLIVWLLLGLFVVFGAPILAEKFIGTDKFAGKIIRGLGVAVIVFSVVSTSFLVVGDGHLAQLFRVYGGGHLPVGSIVAVNGENGPQARVLAPGFHFEWLINVLYDVDTKHEEVSLPQGQVGILVARDGAALRAGQAFADPFSAKLGYAMLDAETFLKNGGQRCPQLTVLTPGKYRLNRYLWDVQTKPAKEIPAGFVGVVKSNVHADIDFGTMKASKPEDCTVIKNAIQSGEELQRLDAPIVPVGCIGVWKDSLQPGQYYFNPAAFHITEIDTRAQVWTYAGGYKRANITLTVDSKGEIVQNRIESEVEFNPKTDADRAVFVKMEGWDVPLELRVIAQVSPSEAACVVAGVGDLRQVEDRVLTPSIRAITRDVAGGTYEVTEPQFDKEGKQVMQDGKPIMITVKRPTKVLDLINQRPLIEGEIERRIRPEGQKSCVTIREVRLGEPAIPPELLVAVRREQLATQLAKAFIQERGAQEKRVDSEKAKATADQQSTLVTSEIKVKTSQQFAIAARNEGQGERDKLSMISEGQKKQTEVLGTNATVKLRQFELTLTTLADFFGKHPEVLTSALANAQKFVPNTVVGGTGAGAGENGLLSAILGMTVSKMDATEPSKTPTSKQPLVKDAK